MVVHISSELHTQLKIKAIHQGIHLQDIVEKILKAYLDVSK